MHSVGALVSPTPYPIVDICSVHASSMGAGNKTGCVVTTD
jgi:hypothetical protein